MRSINKKKMFQWIRTVIFLLIVVCVLGIIKFTIIPSSYARFILHELNDTEENYNCIVLGASHGRSAYDPYVLDEELGDTTTLNMCIPNETVKDSYYLLKESNRKNNPETVILDLDYQYWYQLACNDYWETFIYDQLGTSLVKLEYMFDNLMSKDFRVAISRWSAYLDQLPAAKSNLKNKLSKAYWNYDISSVNNKDAGGNYVGRGFFYRNTLTESMGYGTLNDMNFDSEGVDQETVQYFKKIVRYCKEQKIRLVCSISPITPATVANSWDTYEEVNDFFENLCREQGVEFYNFNLLKQSVLLVKNGDYVDYDGHMTGELADRFSQVAGEVIEDAEDGALKTKHYFYESYDAYCENANRAMLVYGTYDFEKVEENNTYNMTVKIDAAGGEEAQLENRVEIYKQGDKSTIVKETEYSGETNITFNLAEGNYVVKIYSRTVGSIREYEEKWRDTVHLTADGITAYRKNHKKS